MVATGGFGAFDLTPASDVDLLFLHEPGDRAIEDAVSAVLYPLWDAGLRVSHAVRTPEECGVESEQRLESLTAMSSARLISGNEGLAERAGAESVGVARRLGPTFVERLRQARAKRSERFGRLGHSLEPDLKESLGGVRDRQLAAWLGWAFPDRTPESLPSGDLTDLRLALHVANGGTSNRLLAEHHAAVASLLGVEDDGRSTLR